MANRHQRRKAAKAKAIAKAEALAQAERAMTIAGIVRNNKSTPIQRNPYSARCPIADAKGNIYTGYREPRSGGSMQQRSVEALQSRKGVSFGRADSLKADSAAQAGQYLSGRKIREARYAEMQARMARARGERP